MLRSIEEIRAQHPDNEAPHIPILPEELTMAQFDEFNRDDSTLYLGLEKEQVFLTGLRRLMSPFFIIGEAQKGKTNALKILLSQFMERDAPVIIFDSSAMELYGYQSYENVNYIQDMNHFVNYMNELEAEIEEREHVLHKRLQENVHLLPQAIAEEFAPYYIVIDDLDDFYGLQTTSAKEIAEMFQRGNKVGMTFIVTGNVAKLKGAEEITKWFKAATNGLMVSPQGYQSIFPVPVGQDKIAFGDGILIQNGNFCSIQLPKI